MVSTWTHDCLNSPETSWFSEELSSPWNPVYNRSLSPCRSVDQDVGELPNPDRVRLRRQCGGTPCAVNLLAFIRILEYLPALS